MHNIPGGEIMIPLLSSIAVFLTAWGKFSQQVKQLEKQVDRLRNDVAMSAGLATLHELMATRLRHVEQKCDAIESMLNRIDKTGAVLEERSEKPVKRWPEPMRPREIVSSPVPLTKPKRRDDDEKG